MLSRRPPPARFTLPAALLGAWLLPGLGLFQVGLQPLRAQDSTHSTRDPAEDARDRQEALLATVRRVVASADDEPSVLGDLDLAHATESEQKAALTLRRVRVRLDLEKQSLSSVLELLHEISGIPFILTARARKALEADAPTLSISLGEMTLEHALDLLALSLGDYRFAARHGAVLVLHREERRLRTVRRVYDISDLVRPRPDFLAPSAALRSRHEGG